MKVKIQIKSISGKVLFELEKPNNTLKDTLAEANLHGANLHDVNLRYADLQGVDLRSANLQDANLRDADLQYAKLQGANLQDADLRSADLRDAKLQYAKLQGADLYGANLQGANLHGANLHDVNLRGAILYGANLQDADLRSANLYGANLRYADLQYAKLQGADLQGANLEGKALILIKKRICPIPMEGSFIAYKKASGAIVKVKIPEDAKRTWNILNRKCRAEFVDVIEIEKEGEKIRQVIGNYDNKTIYKVGKRTVADSFDDNVREDCSHGIHFFITREEAEDWS